MSDKCSTCQKSLGKKDRREFATACGHPFHFDCAKQRFTKTNMRCPTFREPSALADLLNPKPTTPTYFPSPSFYRRTSKSSVGSLYFFVEIVMLHIAQIKDLISFTSIEEKEYKERSKQ